MKFSDFKKNIDDAETIESSDASYNKAKNLEIILDIVKKINQSLILEDVLELVLRNAIKLTNSERGFIVLSNSTGELEYKIGLDFGGISLPQKLFNISTTVVNDVYQTGLSKFIEGAQTDTNNDPSKSILNLELQTILCSPLIAAEKKIGVIYVDSKKLQKIKIREITDTFEILAGQAATAIKNAQLYNGQITAYNALQEANAQLIQAERKALKSSLDAEIGQSLQGLVHLALLETESLARTIEKNQKENSIHLQHNDPVFYDRLRLKTKVAIDSIRNIQKYAQALVETSIMNLNKDNGDLNMTIQSVIRYLSPMKKFNRIVFATEFNNIPLCNYDSEQIQHLLVQIFTNSADADPESRIKVKSNYSKNQIDITIEDDGPGISEGKKRRIFELPTNKQSGYGLFLCKSIIDQHNGEIKLLESEKGTKIQFSIPVN